MEQKLKRKGVESAYGSKKPRLEGAPQARINPLYQSTDLQEKIRDAWRYVILMHLPCMHVMCSYMYQGNVGACGWWVANIVVK